MVAAAVPLKPERTTLVVGTATEAVSFMPFYIASARIWKAQGLDVQLLGFRGDAEAAQALAGGSIDIAIQSLDMLINLIDSGQPMAGFYAGVFMSDYAWLAQPSIKTWSDLRGKSMGISTFASQGSLLTQFELKRHGLEPLKDVQFLQVGTPGQGAYEALKANRIAATILSPPTKWMAAGAGFTVLGTQAHDIAAQWPKLVFITPRKNLTDIPETLKAFLRSHVLALRLARANRALAIDILAERLKFDKDVLGRTYDEFMPSYDERGHLPQDKYMDVYWKFQMQTGLVSQPWPKAKFFDERFISSFASWAP
jgi:NitT/TauT family transport system substrate-binding protein